MVMQIKLIVVVVVVVVIWSEVLNGGPWGVADLMSATGEGFVGRRSKAVFFLEFLFKL